jgi:hypothetical protein
MGLAVAPSRHWSCGNVSWRPETPQLGRSRGVQNTPKIASHKWRVAGCSQKYYLILSYHEYEISEMSLQWIWKSVSSWFIRLSSSPLGSAFQIVGGQKIYAVSKSCDSWLHPIYIWGISPWFCLPVAATLGSTSIQFCEHRPRSRHPNMSKSERPHDSVGGWRSCGPEKSICDGYPNGYPNGLQCFSSSVFYYKN